MKKNRIMGIIGVIGTICLIIAISGCTSPAAANKTYNNGGIIFQYPGNWSENATFNYTVAPSKSLNFTKDLVL